MHCPPAEWRRWEELAVKLQINRELSQPLSESITISHRRAGNSCSPWPCPLNSMCRLTEVWQRRTEVAVHRSARLLEPRSCESLGHAELVAWGCPQRTGTGSGKPRMLFYYSITSYYVILYHMIQKAAAPAWRRGLGVLRRLALERRPLGLGRSTACRDVSECRSGAFSSKLCGLYLIIFIYYKFYNTTCIYVNLKRAYNMQYIARCCEHSCARSLSPRVRIGTCKQVGRVSPDLVGFNAALAACILDLVFCRS